MAMVLKLFSSPVSQPGTKQRKSKRQEGPRKEHIETDTAGGKSANKDTKVYAKERSVKPMHTHADLKSIGIEICVCIVYPV